MLPYEKPIEILSDDDLPIEITSGKQQTNGWASTSGGTSLSFGMHSEWTASNAPVYIDSDSESNADSDSLPDISSLENPQGRSTKLSSALPASTRAVRSAPLTSTSTLLDTSQPARKSALLEFLSDNTLLDSATVAVPASQDSIQVFTSDPVTSPVKVDYKGKKRATVNNFEDEVPINPPTKKTRASGACADSALAKKESAALEKARQLHEKQLEKARLKAEKEAEKSLAKKRADVNKLRTSKSEAVHEIHLYCSHDLSLPTSPIAGALPEIKRKLEEHDSAIHFLSEDESPTPGLIRFRRHVKATWNVTLKRWDPLPESKWEEESTLITVVDAPLVVAKVQEGSGVLRQWVSSMKRALGMRGKQQLFLVIRGLTKYYRKNSALANSEFRAMARAQLEGTATGRSDGGAQAGRVSKEEVEKQLVRLQVAEGCYLIEVETIEDMENWVWNLTADIAIRPYKLVSRSHLFFCASESSKKSSDPKKSFELMLGEMQGITDSAAAGITDVHPSFRTLMAAFERAERTGGVSKAEALLMDCEIRNLRDGTASGRRLNTALAKRVYHNMRGRDGLALS